MKTNDSKNSISFSEALWPLLSATACFVTIFLLGGVGCKTASIPPIKTYEKAQKEVDAMGPLVSAPIEKREGYKEGTSSVIKKDVVAPHSGILIDGDKAAYYVAVKAERDRRRKELEAARKNLEIQRIIHKSTLEHVEAKQKAHNTWWERNKGLMGFAIGTTVGMAIVVGVMYALTKGSGMGTTSSSVHVMQPVK
jgi:hypothetical protein